MVAVLVDSRQDGQTAMIATRGLRRVNVAGISGCIVELDCGGHILRIHSDGEYELPEGVEFIQAFHKETTKRSRVFIDLLR